MLELINSPDDLRALSYDDLTTLAEEIRETIITTVINNGGHLGSNLGIVELTIALHRVFDSPNDILLFDTGHQAYVHKLLTGRVREFSTLRQPGGLSGYPSRKESRHDWIENSHASTALSYAYGIAASLRLLADDRRVVALVGDGSLTGGIAYEALNNIGHSQERVLIVLNDNGRSYAPTISRLSTGITSLRLYPNYVKTREKFRQTVKNMPAIGDVAYESIHRITSALREMAAPHQFFEALGIRYAGPIDSSNLPQLEEALRRASIWQGPILLHVLSTKGKGYAPAENDNIQRLHDVKPNTINEDDTLSTTLSSVTPYSTSGISSGTSITSLGTSQQHPDTTSRGRPRTYTDAFSKALVELGKLHRDVVAITAAMPGPTGLLPFKELFPERFFDVGIAEEHALIAAGGMAMAGMRPIVAIYSTFFSRAFDQANLDISLHDLPVILVLDRAGITGDDGPSHNGAYDLALLTAIPDMTILTPSCPEDIEPMLREAYKLGKPVAIRFPKTLPIEFEKTSSDGLHARLLNHGSLVCILAVGKTVPYAQDALNLLSQQGIEATLWDVQAVSPADTTMLADAMGHSLVVTVEDGIRYGGAGNYLYQSLMDSFFATSTEGFSVTPPYHLCLGLPRKHLKQGKPDQILQSVGISAQGISDSIQSALVKLGIKLSDLSSKTHSYLK